MRKSVRHDRQRGCRNDVEQPKRCPQPDYREGSLPIRKCVDHAPEQNGLGKLDNSDGDAGHDKRDSKRPLGGQHAKGPDVDFGHIHECNS